MGRLKNKILAKILTRFPSLLDRIVEKTGKTVVSGIPWTPVKKALSQSKVALVTTAGVHLKNQTAFDMRDPDGDPTWRELPLSTPKDGYTITHDYYDHADADKDLNIVFPLDRLKEMKEAGLIGSISVVNFGFMGHIDGPHIETLIKKTAPEVAKRLRSEEVDVVLLTPG